VSASFVFRPQTFELGDLEPARALGALRRHERPFLLDSARGFPRRFSLLGFDPLPAQLAGAPSIAAVCELHAQLRLEGSSHVPGPFHGGLLGALSYDLGAAAERPVRVAPEPWGFPLFVGGLYVDFLVRDEEQRCAWLVLGDAPGDGRPSLGQRHARIRDELASAPPRTATVASGLERCVSAAEHRARVERCRERIAQGDLYQANLAHRFTCAARGAPVDWYERLRSANPAPYMAFAQWPASSSADRAGALLSASPELLLEFDGERARTRPIKGTAPRHSDPREDARAAEQLLRSAKDLAELAMIVDLERNDLAKVCEPRGVWVEGFPRLESYARVHHLMADVVGKPRAGVGAFELLEALFPGGSITGAPKLRSMEILAELEGEGRGMFCGSAGFVDLRGRAVWNILIRTLLWREGARAAPGEGELSFRVGGGVTWSSDPAAEERETLDKARGLLDALGL
jgi:para-aminobenzoate synthetase component 1